MTIGHTHLYTPVSIRENTEKPFVEESDQRLSVEEEGKHTFCKNNRKKEGNRGIRVKMKTRLDRYMKSVKGILKRQCLR